MTLSSLGVLNLNFIDILDIVVVAAIIFAIFRWLKNSSSMNIFIAILFILIIRVLASVLGMEMLSGLLGTVIDVGAIALVVIFQPEIRKFLTRVGRGPGMGKEGRSILDRLFKKNVELMENEHIQEIAEACFQMSEEMTGALIVLRHSDSLQDIVDTGDTIDANIKARLLENIFFKNAPLHDGAIVIAHGRIVAARCTLPITQRMDMPAHYGMRHKAAVGITEICDADAIVVSEQTGRVSFVRNGVITVIKNQSHLQLVLGEKPAS